MKSTNLTNETARFVHWSDFAGLETGTFHHWSNSVGSPRVLRKLIFRPEAMYALGALKSNTEC